MTRQCQWCGSELPSRARSDRRTCSTRCRMALSRARDLPPQEMRDRRRWVRRDAAKAPLTRDGTHYASSTRAWTWSTYEDAAAATAGVGLGYVLAATDRTVCLDLDDCVNPDGGLTTWAREILNRCPPTWVERSPSGTGLHIWGRGTVGTAHVIRDRRKVEVYGQGRYIALGKRWPGAPRALADLSEVLDWLTSGTHASG